MHKTGMHSKKCPANIHLPRRNTRHSELLSLSEMVACIQAIHMAQNTAPRLPGRPRLNISREQLEILLDQQFTQVEIAKIYGCSPRTVHRRILEYGLTSVCQYSTMSDSELDSVVKEFVVSFPTAGYKMLAAHLILLDTICREEGSVKVCIEWTL